MQIFRPDGTFVSEHIYNPATLAGDLPGISLSHRMKIRSSSPGRRSEFQDLHHRSCVNGGAYTFGDGGRQPGLFYAPHGIATDSEGNIYTTGRMRQRVQKFLYQGMRPVTVRDRAPT